MAFKMKHKNSSFPFKSEEKSKKKIRDDIGFDKDYNMFYDKDIQKSYQQRRGRFNFSKKRKQYMRQMYKNRDIFV